MADNSGIKATPVRLVVLGSDGEEMDRLLLSPKQFRTGSVGYWAGGKIILDGERYQVSCSIVKIGSKTE
jgi:hypothetical protein